MTGVPAGDDGWLRLDPRVLLVDPVKVLRQIAVPALVALIGIGSGERPFPWWAVPLVLVGAVAAGTVPWLTTRYRVTAAQFEQRRGLLNRQHLTAPLDRVRSVDLEASLLHRVLGLTKVQVGTGVDDTRITLDALSVAAASDLKALLLSRRTAVPPADERAGADTSASGTGPVATTLAEIDWGWLRFAPFSLSRLVVVGAAVGALGQFGEDLPFLEAERLGSAWQWVLGFALPLVAVAVLVGSVAAWVALSVSGYVLQWWGLRLTRGEGSLHLQSGLVTTRSVTVEEKRIRGVELTEPLLLRWVGGAELATLATGVANGVTRVLPPCPLPLARSVGDEVLAEPGTLTVPLVRHGPRARRRCHVRAQWATLALAAAVTVAAAALDRVDWWAPVLVAGVSALVAVGVAEATYSHLGHALTDRHLVAGSGALVRVRTVLEEDGIIGWVVKESFWQRRAGLVTLVATTAAGAEHVTVSDVPRPTALALADTATPALLTEFRSA